MDLTRYVQLDKAVSDPQFPVWKQYHALSLSKDDIATIPAWEEWNNKIQSLEIETLRLTSELNNINSQLAQAQSEQEIHRQALDFHLKLLSDVMDGGISVLSEALTSVYRKVFNRPDWTVELILEDYRGSKRLSLQVKSPNRGSHTLDSLGGSSVFVLGTIIECYYLVYSGLARIIFFDESLSSLSQEYLDRFLSVLRSFVDDLGFIFLIVDHAPHRFESKVDKVFTTQPHPEGGSVWVEKS